MNGENVTNTCTIWGETRIHPCAAVPIGMATRLDPDFLPAVEAMQRFMVAHPDCLAYTSAERAESIRIHGHLCDVWARHYAHMPAPIDGYLRGATWPDGRPDYARDSDHPDYARMAGL